MLSELRTRTSSRTSFGRAVHAMHCGSRQTDRQTDRQTANHPRGLSRGWADDREGRLADRSKQSHLPLTITGGHHQPLRRAAAHRQGRRLSCRAGGNILSTLCPSALAWPCGSMGCSAALAPDLILSVVEFRFFEPRASADAPPPDSRLAIAACSRALVGQRILSCTGEGQERVAAPRCSAARRSSSSCRRNQLAQRPPCTAD